MGDIAPAEANGLLDKVHYDADLSWTEPTGLGKRDNVANLLVNIIYLSFIMVGFAAVIGVAFGGLRVLSRHIRAEKGGPARVEMEFIKLNLND
jgi:hypothetical protein